MSTPDDPAEMLPDPGVVNLKSPTAAPAPDENLQYGRYTVLRREDGTPWELGRGGMGVTYKAEDPELRRAVVLKVILPTFFGNDPQARARFRREARAAAGVHHAHIATVFDIGEARGEDYYVMEHIAGEDLLTRLRRDGPMDLPTALRLAKQVAEGLDAAWDPARIVHRDLKPANLMLAQRSGGPAREVREGPMVKIVDFDLAKAIKAAGEIADAAGGTGLSSNARPIFSAAYASPEQIDGDLELDIRSDLYSLGVTLWHCLLGHPTFGNTSQQKAVIGHLSKEPPFGELHDAGVPPEVITLLARLLAKSPADRPATPTVLIEELDRLLQGGTAPATAAPPAPSPEPPPQEDHSFTLAEILRQRGTLPAVEALTLLEAMASLIDATWEGPAGEPSPAVADINPARIRFRLDAAPPTTDYLRALPACPLEEWPACSLHLDDHHPAGAENTASLSASVQTLPAAPVRVAVTSAGALAALGYEMLGGQPPPPGRWRPLSALDEAGNDLLREALNPNTRFESAGELASALSAPAVVAPVPEPVTAAPFIPPAPEPTPAFTGRAPVGPPPGRRVGPLVAVGVGFISLVAIVAMFLMRRPQDKATPIQTRPPTTTVATPTVTPDPTPAPTSVPVAVIQRGMTPEATEQSRQARREVQQALNQGDFPRALVLSNKSVELNPNDPVAYKNRGRIYNKLKQSERALTDLNKSIELDPKDPYVYPERGAAYTDLKQFERALTDYDKAIELDPHYDYAYSNRGAVYAALKQPERALADYDRAIQIAPTRGLFYTRRGILLSSLKLFERALTDHNKAIELEPTQGYCYEQRGMTYNGLNQFERALEDFNKALALNPGSPNAYCGRGYAYIGLKQFDRAIEDFNRVTSQPYLTAELYAGRGIAYRALGKTAEAERDFAKAKELGGTTP